MMAAFMKLIVLGEIPGFNVQLDYNESLVLAGAIIMLSVLNASFLYKHRRGIKRRLVSILHKDIELKTI